MQQLLYEGRQKKLYRTDQATMLVQEFKSGAPADSKKKGKVKSIGALRNEISAYLFEYLAGYQIPTHFVKRLSDTEMLVKKLEIVPIVVKIYNVAAGQFSKRYGLDEGTPLSLPVIEHTYKNEEAGFPWVNEFHVYSFGLATPEEFKLMNRLASKVNAVLRALCDRRGLLLASVALEFGRHEEQLLVGDELSPATCDFWDATDREKPDREVFRLHGHGAEQRITELRNRLQRKQN